MRIPQNKILLLLGVIVLVIASVVVLQRPTNIETDTGIPIIPDVPKDAIPPLDSPNYETPAEAASWIKGTDLVLGVSFNGDARAYPLNIMNWHEIVNEVVGGEEVAVTYCPLCKSGIVFDRHLDGQLLSFGNTGSLFQSAMVMYDRETQSYWYQAGFLAIKGPLSGKKLTILPSTLSTWENWLADHPNTEVLSIDTGFSRDYLTDAFTGYDSPNSAPGFPVTNLDTRLPNKTLVAGITINDKNIAYPISLNPGKTIRDTFEDKVIEVKIDEKGQGAKVSFIENGNKVPAPIVTEFWFSWAVAHPNTAIYNK